MNNIRGAFMNKDNIEYIGITPLDEISEDFFTDIAIMPFNNLFFIKRKSPSVKYITRLSIDYSSSHISINSFKDYKILCISGYEDISIDFINDDNKHSSITKNYPLMMNCVLPHDLLDYKLYLPFAVVYPVEKRIIEAKLNFALCYSRKSSSKKNPIDNNTLSIANIDLEPEPSISSVKEIVNIDEEYM